MVLIVCILEKSPSGGARGDNSPAWLSRHCAVGMLPMFRPTHARVLFGPPIQRSVRTGTEDIDLPSDSADDAVQHDLSHCTEVSL